MDFLLLKRRLQENFKELTKDEDFLFEVEVDKDELWNLYLDSFPKGTNLMFRERREFDCSCCRHFIKSIGNVVAIKNNEIKTIWDFNVEDKNFQIVINSLNDYLKNKIVDNIFISQESKIGTDRNFEMLENNDTLKWEHFYLELDNKFVNKSNRTIGDIKGSKRDSKNVFQRSLNEINQDGLLTVLELISQNSLYKGEEWKDVLNKFLNYKKQYDLLDEDKKNNFAWKNSSLAGDVISKIRNHSIGTLLLDISNGLDLDESVTKYERIVAPQNYKRPKAIFTKKMLEDAKKTILELGYYESLDRRFATLEDISINNVIFSNKDSAKKMIDNDIFDEMVKDVSIKSKNFSKVEEVNIDYFIKNILPTTNELEVLFENKNSKNLVSLIAPELKHSKNMFKWDNPFSWSYSGNVTDSILKERVKSAGGGVDGVLRFSIQWNDLNDNDKNDLDAHCIEPNLNRIYFLHKRGKSGGCLDVDITHPQTGVPAVENITWDSTSQMLEGDYIFLVNNYVNRGGKNGFRAEIEFDGNIYSYNYDKALKSHEDVFVATVSYSKKDGFKIMENLKSDISNIEKWNLKTNQFIPVSTVMYSPNYWDNQKGIGNKHHFFMLKDCLNDEEPNAFYNEFLKEDLLKHKRVFEALGLKKAVKYVDNQLSGLGFSSTKRDEIVVKVKGNFERILKIKF